MFKLLSDTGLELALVLLSLVPFIFLINEIACLFRIGWIYEMHLGDIIVLSMVGSLFCEYELKLEKMKQRHRLV